jgi:hypothetical protein
MKTETQSTSDLSKPLAAEDVRCGDFVSVLYEIIDVPSYMWSCDSHLLPPDKPVRLKWRTGDCGLPLKVKAISLPFVYVRKPCGEHCTLDLRHHKLVRLGRNYARTVWKTMSKKAKTTREALSAIL